MAKKNKKNKKKIKRLEKHGMLDSVTELGLGNAEVRHEDTSGKKYHGAYSKPDQAIIMPKRMDKSYPGTYNDLLAHESKHAGLAAASRRLNLAPRGWREDPEQPYTEVWDEYPDIREIVGLLPNFEENPHADTFWNNPRTARQPHTDGLIGFDPRKDQWEHDMIHDTNKINRRHSPNTERRKKDYQNIVNLIDGWGWK
tara:strand:+ start:598 stop:1191 length:594 start_codon:yes stop_codon:yes gene_type:complete